MTARTVPSHIEIEAPDGASALALELRLAHLSPTTLQKYGRWSIEIEGGDDLDEIEDGVARWLRDIDEPSTTMLLDGQPVTIDAHPRHMFEHPIRG